MLCTKYKLFDFQIEKDIWGTILSWFFQPKQLSLDNTIFSIKNHQTNKFSVEGF